MIRINTKPLFAITLMGLMALSATAEADFGYPDVAPQDKIDLCVAEIGERADYGDASYVRHEVESKPRMSVGHTLRISTQVLDASDGHVLREYRTLCAVADRDEAAEPVLFRIREKQ